MSKIYEPQGKAREYSPLALNIYKGCTHGCRYCYVPKMMGRFRAGYDHAACVPSLNVKELEASCRKWKDSGRRVLLSFTGDPYCGVSPETTRTALEILASHRIPTAILSKGGKRMMKDIDIFRKFDDIRLGVSLTFSHINDSKKWEPGAALPLERLETLEALHNEGFTTWASFEPVVFPDQSLNMLCWSAEFLSYAKIGKINHFPEIERGIDWSAFLCEAVRICEMNNLPYYIKDDLAAAAPSVKLKPECRIADNFS